MCPHLKSAGPQELRCERRIVPLEDEGQSLTEIMLGRGRDHPREGGQTWILSEGWKQLGPGAQKTLVFTSSNGPEGLNVEVVASWQHALRCDSNIGL